VEHKSGFVNIIGNPNVGKSTLLNALIGEKLSIITNKPQTTRHRILAIINENDYQIVFSDTPGIIDEPHYKMQSAMNSFAYSAFEDADVLVYMTDTIQEKELSQNIIQRLTNLQVPSILVINKIDLSNQEQLTELVKWYTDQVNFKYVCAISALENEGVKGLLQIMVDNLPVNPPYYPKDQFTDRSERFFISEIIREKILTLYHQEIPYSCEVIVNSFKEEPSRSGPMIHIMADIIVNRKTQKSIIIGKGGISIKQLGTDARKSIEEFLESKVFLELHVKVKEKWRDDDNTLKSYGYLH
jgi:GTPase